MSMLNFKEPQTLITCEMIEELLETEGLFHAAVLLYLWLLKHFGYNRTFIYKDFLDEYPGDESTIRKQVNKLVKAGVIESSWYHNHDGRIRKFKIK